MDSPARPGAPRPFRPASWHLLLVWIVSGLSGSHCTPEAVAASPPHPAASAATHVPAQALLNTLLLARVGLERRTLLIYARADLKARPVDFFAPLHLRIAAVRPEAGGRFLYEVAYTPQHPGTFDLGAFLLTPEGESAGVALAGATQVQVSSLLPENDPGKLRDMYFAPRRAPVPYFTWISLLTVLWVEAGVWAFRRPARVQAPVTREPEERPRTMAEVLGPLLRAAASGRLDVEGKARLERLLLRFWSARLALESVPPAERLRAMRADPQAGGVLRALDAWVHQPKPQLQEHEIAELLAAYADVLLPPAAEEVSHLARPPGFHTHA